MPDLPKAACALLDKDYVRSTSVVEKAQKSSDGSTCKLLVRLQDGMQVEAVVMTYDKDGAGTCASHLYTEFPSDCQPSWPRHPFFMVTCSAVACWLRLATSTCG